MKKTKILKGAVIVLLTIIAAINLMILTVMIFPISRIPIAQILRYIPQSDIEDVQVAQKEYETIKINAPREKEILLNKRDSCLKSCTSFDRDWIDEEYQDKVRHISSNENYAKVEYNLNMLKVLVLIIGSLISVELILFWLLDICKAIIVLQG